MQARRYHLVVEGELSRIAARAFEGMEVTSIAGTTVIAGPVRDQAELHARLRRVADLGLTLLSAAAVPHDAKQVPNVTDGLVLQGRSAHESPSHRPAS